MIGIVHISDIHLKKGPNTATARVPQIKGAVQSEVHDITDLALLVTGDVAFSGKQEEYSIATDFLVELEDARENSLFEPVKGRDYPRWSSRFERGFSQLVDWAWRIDHERQPSATLEAAFGTADPRIHYLLVIGRDRWIGAAGRARLDWRHRHNGISGERTTVWTYDDLFSFVSDRLAVAEQDASELARMHRDSRDSARAAGTDGPPEDLR